MKLTATAATLVLLHAAAADWLVTPPSTPTTLKPWSERGLSGVELSNGLLSRRFITKPAFATWDFVSLLEDSGPSSLLRGVAPETVVTLDGTAYNVGGLLGNASFPALKTSPFLNRSALAASAAADPAAFRYVSHSTAAPVAPFSWTPGVRGSPSNVAWPPKGLRLDVVFEAPPTAPAAVRAVRVVVHYELYQGRPILAKWVSVSHNGSATSGPWAAEAEARAASASLSSSFGLPQSVDESQEAEAPPDPCAGDSGCAKCPGTLYMRR